MRKVNGVMDIVQSFDISDINEKQNCLGLTFISDNNYVNLTAFVATNTRNIYIRIV